MSRRRLVLIILVLVGCTWARTAFACEGGGPIPTREALRMADLVYTGWVVAIRDRSPDTWPEIEFTVDRTLKGTVNEGRVIVHTPLRLTVSCDGFPFERGKPYLVFATTRDLSIGRAYGVSWTGGTVALNTSLGRERLREARAMTGRR